MRPLLLIILIAISINGQSQDYTKYHLSIIETERQLFIEENLEKGLISYLNTFKKYDFVFLSDVMMAMQISLLNNDEQAFLTLADKATKNGLLPRHLIKFYFIQKHPFYQKHKDSIITLYRKNRPHYLSRIDTVALQKMYDLFAYDQMEKLGLPNESEYEYSLRYAPQIKKTMDELTKLIRERGFPSDKTIGIAQNDIMREMKLSSKDLIYYYHDNITNYNVSKGQLLIYEWKFSSTFFRPIMAHYYSHHQKIQPHNDAFYLKQIRLGNVHPRDLAKTFDFPFSTSPDSTHRLSLSNGGKFFCLVRRNNIEDMEGSYKGISFSQINQFRKQFFIAPIEQDIAKIKFAKKYGVYIPYVANGNR